MDKVIVAVNTERHGNEHSALEWAIVRARETAMTLEILTVLPRRGAPDEARRALERIAGVTRARVPEVPVTVSVRRGPVADVLLSVSRRADLLVVESTPVGAVSGVVLGTLALRIAGRAQCTVAVVPRGWVDGPSDVVVGWTDDETADRALDRAGREAAHRGGALTIVTSWTEAFGHDRAVAAEFYDVTKEVAENAADRVRRAHPGVPVELALESGSAAEAIVDRGRSSGLVIVGTHGRGALGSLILGSTSHDVILNLPAPVLVVPAPGGPITVLPEILDEELL
ncbi:nucleotide-binding universal stress UspA family protein [Microbacteriaceae bacterium SG_E_30_P1]|uniref:Nucleotide-binding universal stress UspA family protein n=1 Tax=Antiquaquibacter oligotrophicus TaxID=2880260 RepID=A0ABT6KQ16_9MICO|nr:universal stress protein [Antiquaquibacter oligotrophicus]MDH6182075.1 nucleotide-binding universal stress UspA family protein [Antiquaquibacter oligotrophicus]UDF12259.1 universal stress protein [Antiquaquibacter oligotrophicus]